MVVALAGCEDDILDVSEVTCPNEVPDDGNACPEAGLVCNYFTGCDTFHAATCQQSLTWSFDNTCVPPDPLGGAGGVGGSGA